MEGGGGGAVLHGGCADHGDGVRRLTASLRQLAAVLFPSISLLVWSLSSANPLQEQMGSHHLILTPYLPTPSILHLRPLSSRSLLPPLKSPVQLRPT